MEKLLDQIKKCAGKYPNIYKIVLFGSRARGDYRTNSDIDLAIFSKSNSNLEIAKFTSERIKKTHFCELKRLSEHLVTMHLGHEAV